MYKGLPTTPQAYVLSFDQEEEVRTVFHILPETARSTRKYALSMKEEMDEIQGPTQAARLMDIEWHHGTERLVQTIQKIENAEEPGDSITSKEEIKKFVEGLCNVSRQELLLVGRSWPHLRLGLLKNLKSSRSTSSEEAQVRTTG